ncbi:hypothetical protein [Aquimarina sp. 2201CG14-23]|uniref:hypothetical protein n=1 Tax=Aquimarina mycalae TaxID=3040073 RepID=UPI002477D2C6|nr:hypothetical protein [Aquimarina sp. 2201CG14-23]MDH7446922.1 hypothetical protein [Aquimarina sp. 2201CG14-23]
MSQFKLSIVILTFFLFTTCNGQNSDDFLAKSQIRSSLVTNEVLSEKENNKNPYILFSISDSSYIIVENTESNYLEKIVELTDNKIVNILSVEKIEKPNHILQKGFNKENYYKEFISFESDFYKDGYEIAKGSKTYFVMVDTLGDKYGESILSIIVRPNPIDEELYSYLASKLLNFNK